MPPTQAEFDHTFMTTIKLNSESGADILSTLLRFDMKPSQEIFDKAMVFSSENFGDNLYALLELSSIMKPSPDTFNEIFINVSLYSDYHDLETLIKLIPEMKFNQVTFDKAFINATNNTTYGHENLKTLLKIGMKPTKDVLDEVVNSLSFSDIRNFLLKYQRKYNGKRKKSSCKKKKRKKRKRDNPDKPKN